MGIGAVLFNVSLHPGPFSHQLLLLYGSNFNTLFCYLRNTRLGQVEQLLHMLYKIIITNKSSVIYYESAITINSKVKRDKQVQNFCLKLLLFIGF